MKKILTVMVLGLALIGTGKTTYAASGEGYNSYMTEVSHSSDISRDMLRDHR